MMVPDALTQPAERVQPGSLDPAARQAVERIVGTVSGFAGSTEASFLEVGERLEAAIGVLGGLAATFDALLGELEGDALRRATGDLSQSAERVSSIAGAHHGEQATLGRVGELAVAIDRRVPPMRKAIKAVEVLAINARIAAASIGPAGAEFNSFLSELARPLGVARTSLDQFGAELGAVGDRVRAARAEQLVFAQRQAAAVDSVPRQLVVSVDAIAEHGARAAVAAAAIGRKSQQVGERIAAAVAALQIGDTTRQRVEHVAEALGMLASSDGADWRALSAAQRQGLGAAVFRLQAAQLGDAADELEREAQRIVAVLKELGADAREIVRLGQDAYAAANRPEGTFLTELLEQVGKASALLRGFADARLDAERVVASVSEGAQRLVGHISTISSLEADLRIMGLNTTLKCSRLGALGRPLSVIAQELRAYANETASEATAIMTDLEGVLAAASSLAERARAGAADDIGAVTEIMTQSVGRIEAAGGSLAGALETLDRDSDAVARLLAETATRFADDQALGKTLRQAATELAALADAREPDAEDAADAKARLLAAIERRYTMVRERAVHDHFVHGRPLSTSPAAAPVGPAVIESAIDDLLF